jgi:ribonuclease HI
VIYKTLALQNIINAPLKDRIPRDIMIPQQKDTSLAWFDGAAQRDDNLCGAGGVIKTIDSRVIRWIYNCGRGTNTREKLMGAWATLMLADYLSLHRIQVMGDSRVVIDWLLNKGRLQVCAVEGWKSRIKVLIKRFQSISFQHIYRSYNIEADILSKQAFDEPEGKISYYHWSNGAEGPRRHIRIH